MKLWLTVLGMGLISWTLRATMIAGLGDQELPDWLKRALPFAPPAVLTAIIFTQVLKGASGGPLDISPGNERIYAWLIAAAVAWKTRHVVATLAAGMAALWILGALGL
jgi:branched-subunit amino acid transport protein